MNLEKFPKDYRQILLMFLEIPGFEEIKEIPIYFKCGL